MPDAVVAVQVQVQVQQVGLAVWFWVKASFLGLIFLSDYFLLN